MRDPLVQFLNGRIGHAGQAKAGICNHNPALPCVRQEPNHLSHALMCSSVCISRDVELGEKLGTPVWDVGVKVAA